MNTEIVPHSGWNRNYLLSNAHLELIATLDVGPRILSLKNTGGENVFHTFEDQLGSSSETEWKIRGGHRLWIAPEDLERTYHIDNHPVEHRKNPDTNEVLLDSIQETGGRILKTIGITLAPDAPRATIRHTVRNLDTQPTEVAAWALTVMRPGGIEVIPQPPLGEHPRDLLPNRAMILWPYTDMSDPRWHFGRDFIMLRQSEGFGPTKLGLAHSESWVAYIVDDSLFIKSFAFLDGRIYADGGCNFETFANSEILEIETLSPLKTLSPGEEITHIEDWCLFPIEEEILIESEEALADWLSPYLQKAGIIS